MHFSIIEIDLPPCKRRIAHVIDSSRADSIEDVVKDCLPCFPIKCYDITTTCKGRNVSIKNTAVSGSIYRVSGKLIGGKGGFGSLLRAIGMQIEKTKNKEACRDLSGRRMRDVNNEKKLKDWFSKAADRMLEKERRKLEKRERLLQQPKAQLEDPEYMKQKEHVIEEMEAALNAGMEKARKRTKNLEPSGSSAKKLKTIDSWSGVDVSTLSSDSEESNGSSTSSDLDGLEPPELCFSDDENRPDNVPSSVGELPSNLSEENIASKPIDKSESSSSSKKPDIQSPLNFEPIVLDNVESISELEKYGLDHLKADLRRRNMKCGGTLKERAKRLWDLKFSTSNATDEKNRGILPTSKREGDHC